MPLAIAADRRDVRAADQRQREQEPEADATFFSFVPHRAVRARPAQRSRTPSREADSTSRPSPPATSTHCGPHSRRCLSVRSSAARSAAPSRRTTCSPCLPAPARHRSTRTAASVSRQLGCSRCAATGCAPGRTARARRVTTPAGRALTRRDGMAGNAPLCLHAAAPAVTRRARPGRSRARSLGAADRAGAGGQQAADLRPAGRAAVTASWDTTWS
jgi:hypothetical protein